MKQHQLAVIDGSEGRRSLLIEMFARAPLCAVKVGTKYRNEMVVLDRDAAAQARDALARFVELCDLVAAT